LGNSILLADLLDKYSPETVKYALLQTNYRGDINITDNLFPDADKHMYEFYKVLDEVDKSGLKAEGGNAQIDAEFNRAMDDDFNTAKTLADLFGLFKTIKAKLKAGDASAVQDARQIRDTYGLLGFFRHNPAEFISYYEAKQADANANVLIPEDVKELAEKRFAAKKAKDWPTADALRAEITKLGYVVKDSKDGYTIEKA
ncbi:MAG: hypothetical protein II867_00810, partial [Clostridia bacterium]|nr:hypothetical protein [Clostridia bacterium]